MKTLRTTTLNLIATAMVAMAAYAFTVAEAGLVEIAEQETPSHTFSRTA